MKNHMCVAGYLVVMTAVLVPHATTAPQSDQARSTPALAGEPRNEWYRGNRAPLIASPLVKLPVGAVRPEGWLRKQLELEGDGFSGRLTDISRFCAFNGNAWVSPVGQGNSGWEEVPYWLRGYVDLAHVMKDPRMTAEATRWVEGVLASQDSSGYFGPRRNLLEHDIWPNMVMLYAVRTHYEATADPRVIPFMLKYFRWLTTVPLEEYLPGSWQKIRGGDNLDHIYWLYNQTGEPWLLELGRLNHERTADWTGGIASWHGVNICQSFREPAGYYQQSGDRRHLQAAERNYRTVMETYGQVPGGLFGADENARPGYSGPRQGAESCSMAEMMFSDELLVSWTGEPVWADRCEEIALNSFPAAMTPDLKGLHYLTAANMVQLDRAGKAPFFDNDGDMLSYNPHAYRCCQHNVAFGWPYYTEYLWMASAGNGLAAVLYAASTVTAKVGTGTTVTITEKTGYPFEEKVELRLEAASPVRFPLALRIPGWCSAPRVTVNGSNVKSAGSSKGWLVIDREWKSGDLVVLELPQQLSVRRWKKNMNSVSVDLGPLTYSLKIGERWERVGGTEPWPQFEVFPTTPWNYGLVIDRDRPEKSITIVRGNYAPGTQPFTFDQAPIQLTVTGKKIPSWGLESNGLIEEIQASPVRSSSPAETVTLIPMGCARLRVSAFPWISESPDANEWD